MFGLALVAWLVALIPLTARAGGKEPVITGIRPSGTNLLVTVQLPTAAGASPLKAGLA